MAGKKAIKLEDLNIIKDYIDEAVSDVKMTVDSELKDDSTNPIQNKVVKAKIDILEGNMNTMDGELDTVKNTVNAIPDTYYKKTDTVNNASEANDANYAIWAKAGGYTNSIASRLQALENEKVATIGTDVQIFVGDVDKTNDYTINNQVKRIGKFVKFGLEITAKSGIPSQNITVKLSKNFKPSMWTFIPAYVKVDNGTFTNEDLKHLSLYPNDADADGSMWIENAAKVSIPMVIYEGM